MKSISVGQKDPNEFIFMEAPPGQFEELEIWTFFQERSSVVPYDPCFFEDALDVFQEGP